MFIACECYCRHLFGWRWICGGVVMISQELIDKNEKLLNDIAEGKRSAENACDELVSQLNETDANCIKVIEDNAELHKEFSKLRNRLDVIESS